MDWHHIEPLFRGGQSREDNLIPVCRKCHQKIHAKDKEMKRQGWLALAEKVGDVSAHMRWVQNHLRNRLGEAGYRDHMRAVRAVRAGRRASGP